MWRYLAFTGLIVLLIGCNPLKPPEAAGTEPGPKPGDPPSPEMKVLEDLVGTWDDVSTNKPSEWLPKAGTSTAVTTRVWALGGKAIRAEGTWEPAKTEYLHLLTYDAGEKVYRSYYFDAQGVLPRTVAKGTWDEKTRTLHFIETDDAGNKTVSRHCLIDKDHSEWSMTATSPTGTVLLDMSGKSIRRKG